MKKLAILGTGGHSKVVVELARLNNWEQIVFFDDFKSSNTNCDFDIYGNTKTLIESINDFDGIIIAIGNNEIRWKKFNEFKNLSAPFVSLVHPSATISDKAQIHSGSVIMAKAVIQVDTIINKMSIINTGSNIDHDCKIGNAVHISPGVNIAGGVKVGDLSWIGIGSSIIENIQIGRYSFVASGSTVVKNVENNSSVRGIPAKEFKR